MIRPYLGKEITSKIAEHTKAALYIIKQLPVIGMVDGANKIHQDIDDLHLTWKEWDLDYSKGLWWQMMNLNWTLKEYRKFIDQPKSLLNPWRSVRFFDNIILETITMGPWFLTPVVILPLVIYNLYHAQTTPSETTIAFLFGIFIWSFYEYCLHRFLFHAEQSWLPDNTNWIACHFVLNGIHHCFPQDYYRLVFPQIPVHLILGIFVYLPTWLLTPEYYFYAFCAGIYFGYNVFEVWHYFSHFADTENKLLLSYKKLHVRHHYKQPLLGFGISNNFWDWVLNTELK